MQERLQKIMARAGKASRRKAEELILQGRVQVNGETVRELGSKADPRRDKIKVDGKLLRLPSGPHLYFMLNKPKACMVTTRDPQGRQTVMDLVGRLRNKVLPVGRLDYHSEGLLILTNDGELANQILSARNKVPKTYHVKINGTPGAKALEKFRTGIAIDGRVTAPAQIRPLRLAANPWFEVTLTEGRKNQIRRMFQKLGFRVEKLSRVRIGPLKLGTLGPAKFRELTEGEVEKLRSCVTPSGAAPEAEGKRNRNSAKTGQPS